MRSSICFVIALKGFSVVKQQIFFRPKGIYLQINRKKNGKNKEDTPTPTTTPTPIPSRRFTDTRLQEYGHPIKERNAHVKNAIFNP